MILTGRVGEGEAGMRLDDGAVRLFPQLSKTRVRKIIDWGGCAVAGAMVRVASRTLRAGEEIVLGVMEPERYQELAYTRDDLLFENGDYLAVNKAAGLNCQRTPYQLKGTVEHAVTLYLRTLGSQEPARVIHRLDRGTSGVMIFPKTKRAAAHISAQLKEGRVEKVYWALVTAEPASDQWEVNAPIAKVGSARYGVATPGREALTRFAVIARGTGGFLVEARPLTGRTHQIRVHLAHCGLPIVGDATYGGEKAPRMMLHCRAMSFTAADGRPITAEAPLDDPFRDACANRGILL
ncbi:RluA family pseudouridine synthase [Geobacter grbiciae]|uniref:RluA family pseudouridine synthase n=1 Tax=Geobacter grbiciae TaxID=155042 RepID=UPI001C01C330|nr:RluA family pseudouridine synthase [Geobacter grbiciae]MBT1073819.1 RluA family pseudouridine synthase [Geobacter grbiciae]